MSPLDNELHDALHQRATSIAAPADPMAGIERRAAGIRRRRLVGAVAAGALVIAAGVAAVPALLPGSPTAKLTPATQGPTAAPTAAALPANLLQSWPQRGGSTRAPSTDELAQRFAAAMGRPGDSAQVGYRTLFIGDTGRGEAFTVGQAWFHGDSQAYDVAYTTGARDSSGALTNELFLGKPTPADPVVLAFQVPNLAGMSDLLVVVPQPGTGQVLYADSASAAFRPITGQERYDGVVLVDRQLSATDDQLELLDGNGDTTHPTYQGPVAPLVCGLKECG